VKSRRLAIGGEGVAVSGFRRVDMLLGQLLFVTTVCPLRDRRCRCFFAIAIAFVERVAAGELRFAGDPTGR
jgi:hypothetical protein